jgi:hypothetical protein
VSADRYCSSASKSSRLLIVRCTHPPSFCDPSPVVAPTATRTPVCLPMFSQFGGIGWDGKPWPGSTVCSSGNLCRYQNQWYAQCIPSGRTRRQEQFI